MLSEIAWMGTDVDANNEWIEIYNFGNEPQDLAGWTLTSGAGLAVALGGVLEPHGVGILERTDDATVPDVIALAIYTGALANTGDSASLTLTLKDPDGVVVDEVVGGTDWSLIGGSNTVPKKTAQRTMTNTWVTAAPTPGAQNAQVSDDVDEDDEDEDDTEDDDDNTSTSTVKKSSGSKKTVAKLVVSDAELTITLSHPEVVYAGKPVTFSVTPSGIGHTIMNSLVYTWNLGDTSTGVGKSVTHTYEHPGTYLLVLEAVYRTRSVILEYLVEVLPMNLTLVRSTNGDLIVTNKTESTIDVSGYTLKGTTSFVFPKLSRIPAGSSLVIDKSRIGGNTVTASLADLRGAIVASVGASPTFVAKDAGPMTMVAVTPNTKSIMAVQGTLKTGVEPVADPTRDTERAGIVAGTSTVFEGLTIPVYAAENGEKVPADDSRSYLPYAGLITLIVVGIVLLYRRPETP
jgi:plastocyanin